MDDKISMMMEQGKPNTKRKPSKAEMRKNKAITDVRRTYSQLLLNAFNSCELSKLKKVFQQYCTPDLSSVIFYSGMKNPHAGSSTEMKSVESHVVLWSTLFKSAPDFLFESEFVSAYIHGVTKLGVIKSKFRFSGTRILDVKVAKVENERVMRRKLEKKNEVSYSLFRLLRRR